MDIESFKKILQGFNLNIKPTRHGFKRAQDKKRNISYPLLVQHITNPKALYRIEEQDANCLNERKFKLWFRLNYDLDLNIYISIPKSLNKDSTLNIISAHKVKRKLQKTLPNRNMMKK